MWFLLTPGLGSALELTDVQSIWPAPDGSNSELVITTTAKLRQEVVLVSPRVCRLRYTIMQLKVTMVLGAQDPAPWPDASKITGRSFELMLTDKGPLVVPSDNTKLPNRLASWLETVSEDMRSCWPVPPDLAVAGTEWEATPALPGGLPPNTLGAKIKIRYQMKTLRDDRADIAVRFGMRVLLKPPRASKPQKAEGRGELNVVLERNGGFASAKRQGVLEIIRPASSCNQLIRSRMEARAASRDA